MILLVIGVLCLAGVYLAPVFAPWRPARPLRAASAVLALAVIVFGWRIASPAPLYNTPGWGWYGAFILTFAASLCLAQFIFRGRLRDRLKSPFDLAIILWGAGHLFVNGTLAGLVLFGGLGLAGGLHLAYAAGHPPPGLAVREGHDVIALIFGAALFGLLSQLHIVYAGVPAFALPHAVGGP